jgi:sugar/nucleoside kinase (ribokinase family)
MSQANKEIEYLVIGHVARDVTATGYAPGGTALFSAACAQAHGLTTAVVTSTHPSYNLNPIMPHIHLHVLPATADTIFANQYQGDQRTQIIHSIAATLTADAVPVAWQTAEIVHLGPIANEIDPAVINLFDCERQTVGLTPQGWMRRWDDHGRVSAHPFPAAEALLRQASIVVLSTEDLLDDDMLTQYRHWAAILVLTQDGDGCTIFTQTDNDPVGRHIPTQRHIPVDPTGAGDIFATALFIRYTHNGRDIVEAASYANRIAGQAVLHRTLADKVAI